MTDDLIDRLSGDLRPVRGGAVTARLLIALGVGIAVALAGVGLGLGFRRDMGEAMGSMMFWMKLTYALAFAVLGVWCVARLARPVGSASRRLPWLAAPAAAILVLAIVQLARAPAAAWRPLIMGHSAMICPWLILAAAVPVFVALIWALRGLAPTRPRLAGGMAGLAAGGAGAAVYALHCPEAGAPFVAIWYSLGLLSPYVIGIIAGPRLLRW